MLDNTLSNEEYHAKQAIGSTGLKYLKRSPAHYYANFLDPDREPKEQTAAQLLGSAVHMAILEPEIFDDTYIVLPDGIDRRTKEGKQLYQEIMDSGKTPLSTDFWNKIHKMRESAYKLSLTHKLHKIALAEHSIFFNNCKIRPDWHVAPCCDFPNGLIVDLKTCGDASNAEFSKNAWNSDMHLQAALYCKGFEFVYGTKPDFMWLAIETLPPYACAFHKCPQNLLDYGYEEVEDLLELYNECLTSNHWHAYPEEVKELELPSYALRMIDGIEETEVNYV